MKGKLLVRKVKVSKKVTRRVEDLKNEILMMFLERSFWNN